MAFVENHDIHDIQSSLTDSSQFTSPYDHPHYEACRILDAAGAKFCVWAEDALSNYGVPTLSFDLYLVVENVTMSAQLLSRNGFILKPLENDILPIPEFHERHGPPGPENERDVVLLAASDWDYDIYNTTPGWLPPFRELLDCLMWRWTNPSSTNLRMRLANYISYCFLYVDGVKTLGFAAQLRKENRQLHFDLVDGSSAEFLSTIRCQEHYRTIRAQIRSGELDPTGPSGVCLFPEAVELQRQLLIKRSPSRAEESDLEEDDLDTLNYREKIS